MPECEPSGVDTEELMLFFGLDPNNDVDREIWKASTSSTNTTTPDYASEAFEVDGVRRPANPANQ